MSYRAEPTSQVAKYLYPRLIFAGLLLGALVVASGWPL